MDFTDPAARTVNRAHDIAAEVGATLSVALSNSTHIELIVHNLLDNTRRQRIINYGAAHGITVTFRG